MTDLTVARLHSLTDEDARSIESLLPQLSLTATFDRGLLEESIAHQAIDLFVARLDGEIVGMATLVSFPLPTGVRGHVDDVVVDGAHRGEGIGRRLLEDVIRVAQDRRMRTLDLSSRPSRQAAIGLYESLGFERRDSLLMRYTPVPHA